MQRKLNSRKIKHLISCLSLSLTLYKHTALKTIRYLAVLEWGSPEEHRGLFPSYILWQIHSSVITGDLWNPRLLQLYFSPPPQLFWAMTKLWQWWLQRKCSKATCWKCSSLVFCVFLCSHPATCALSFAIIPTSLYLLLLLFSAFPEPPNAPWAPWLAEGCRRLWVLLGGHTTCFGGKHTSSGCPLCRSHLKTYNKRFKKKNTLRIR